jgi:hypothetical protein
MKAHNVRVESLSALLRQGGKYPLVLNELHRTAEQPAFGIRILIPDPLGQQG